MNHTKTIILLLILISSYFFLQVIQDKEIISSIDDITTRTILEIQSKATAVLASLSIIVDSDIPKIYIASPLNKTYNYNSSIELNFTVVDNTLDKIYYNIDNGTNITVTGNITFSVSSTSPHKLTLFANDTSGQVNSSSVTFSINLSKGHDIDFNSFSEGQTTNFTLFNITQLQNLSNVKIEKLNAGIIKFIDSLNLSKELNISAYINISSNRIEIQSNFLPDFNKNATLEIYNLTFTNPRILKDNEVCSSSFCKQNSYSSGILSFNVTGFTVYSVEETPSEGGGAIGGAGGGGSGGGGRKSALTDFRINTNLLKISLLQGETKRELIEIENTGTSTLNLQIDLENIQDFLIFPGGVSKYSLTLKPGEKQSIQLIFNVAKNYKPGVYPGRIIVSSPITKKIITTIVEVESGKKIFDIDVEIQEKKVVKGTNLIAEIVIFSLGQDLGRVDTQVEFGIKDFDGDIISKEQVRLAVQTQSSFTESILVPKYLEDGRYVFYAVVTFDSEIGSATEIFEVISRPAGFLALSTLYIYIIPGFISIIIILVLLEYLKHHYKKKILEIEKPAITTEISEKPKERFDINKFLKDIEKEEPHGLHKKTLETKLKVLKQDYELGLINEEEYLKAKRKIENKIKSV